MKTLKLPVENGSCYPSGYLKSIRKEYGDISLSLKKLAKATPPETQQQCENFDLLEYRFLQNQHQLLELGAALQPSNLEDIVEILKLWYEAAIKDISPFDIKLTDELVLVAYKYFESLNTG